MFTYFLVIVVSACMWHIKHSRTKTERTPVHRFSVKNVIIYSWTGRITRITVGYPRYQTSVYNTTVMTKGVKLLLIIIYCQLIVSKLIVNSPLSVHCKHHSKRSCQGYTDTLNLKWRTHSNAPTLWYFCSGRHRLCRKFFVWTRKTALEMLNYAWHYSLHGNSGRLH